MSSTTNHLQETKPDLSLFKHKIAIQPRFSDIDMMGHLNNAHYVTYFEVARMHYFNDLMQDKIQWLKQGIILANVNVDYLSPLLLTDKISVYTRCSRIGGKSLDLDYQVWVEREGKSICCAKGKTVQVAFDYTLQKSISVPTEWIEILHTFEGQILNT